jgi:Arc/MetJ-type ribon-helix-helix transcriptional regulator
MQISLSEETQRLLDDRMRRGGYPTPDDAVRAALQSANDAETEELDDQTMAAIEEGLAQAKRGQVRPWEDVREEFRARFVKK